MKKIKATYVINFDEYNQLRQFMSIDEYNELLRHKMCNAVSEELFKDDSIKINKIKERFNELRYEIDFNFITNKELKDIIDLIRENKLDLQPEFYYTLLEKLTALK